MSCNGHPKFNVIISELCTKNAQAVVEYQVLVQRIWQRNHRCLSGLIGIFDFRQGHSSRKLLSDGRHTNRHETGIGSSTSKLNMLTESDEKHQGVNNVMKANSSWSLKLFQDGLDNKMQSRDDNVKSVKKLMEQEISTRQRSGKQIPSAKDGHKHEPSENCKKEGKAACEMAVHDSKVSISVGHQQPFDATLLETSNEVDCASIRVEDFKNETPQRERDSTCAEKPKCHLKHSQLDEIDMQLVQRSETTKGLCWRKFHSGNGITHHSKQFLDAVEILSSNEELFVKLMQQPNSVLARHIQNFRDFQAAKGQSKPLTDAGTLEYEQTNAGQHKGCVRTSSNHQHADKIVILKPGTQKYEARVNHVPSLKSQSSSKSSKQGVKSTYFSLKSIKKKLKSAVGVSRKEQNLVLLEVSSHEFQGDCQSSHQRIGEKVVGRDIISDDVKKSDMIANRDDVKVVGRDKISVDVKKSDMIANRNEVNLPIENDYDLDLSTFTCFQQSESNIYDEARKHLCNLLTQGDESGAFLHNQVPRTLAAMLSLPELDLSPESRHVWEGKHNPVSSEMRFSPYRNLKTDDANFSLLKMETRASCESPLRPKVEDCPGIDDEQQNSSGSAKSVSENTLPISRIQSNICSIAGNMDPTDCATIMETEKAGYAGESDLQDVPFTKHNGVQNSNALHIEASNALDVAYGSGEPIAITNSCNDEASAGGKFSECLALNTSGRNQLLMSSPPCMFSSRTMGIHDAEDLDSPKTREGQPSPVSVLEAYFTEEASSPASTISQSAEPPIQPLHISFDKHHSTPMLSPLHDKMTLSPCLVDHWSTSDYISAVLHVSGLNWNELSGKRQLSDQLLEPSLFDDLELLSTEPSSEHKLLFDCINEVLLEVHEQYFGCSPWISSIKPRVRPVPSEKNGILEVIEGVSWHLLPLPPPNTLDQLIGKDLTKSEMWTDFRIQAEGIVNDTVDTILYESIEDTIFQLRV
ncbi:protein of unknown function DUF4378 [Dillenia turbinata]|uniref:DUF4378 domain-containing protein n=1 Tax=Dillenia turbinata TaxID=194707 RepID=A0AAN8ZIE2_9MAGN